MRRLEGQIACAGRDIEHHGAARLGHRDSRPPPASVEPERHQGVDQVIMRNDRPEHIPDALGLVADARGLVAKSCGFAAGGIVHLLQP